MSNQVWFDFYVVFASIAEKYFDIWVILNIATVKSVEPGDNSFSINRIVRCRSKLLPLGFLKGPVKLIKRVKIAHSFSQSVSNQFHVIILSSPM